MKKYIRRGDVLLAAALLVFAFSVYLFRPSGTSERFAVIRSDGAEVRRVSLADDGREEFLYEGKKFGPVLIVKENGEIFFSQSSCNDKLCIGFGHLSQVGDFAACVPNHLSIEIVSGEKRGVDVIA